MKYSVEIDMIEGEVMPQALQADLQRISRATLEHAHGDVSWRSDTFFIAFLGESSIGFIAFRELDDQEVFGTGFAVSTQFQGQQIGSALFSAFEEEMSARETTVQIKSSDDGIDMYLGRGYREDEDQGNSAGMYWLKKDYR